MTDWDIYLDYFSNGIIPHSEYVWVVVAFGLCAYALYKARKMVSEF